MGKCIVCGKNLDKLVYWMENMPSLVQHLPLEDDLANDSGMNLELYECSGCGLFQFDCEPVFYYRDVIRAVGISDTLRNLRTKQYTDFIDRFSLKGAKVFEAGCGAGEFLEIFNQFDVEPYGVENDTQLVNIAVKKGLNVERGFVDEDYNDSRGPFDAFVSFNYLEHQPNPKDMLYGIYNNLKPEGVGLITVPSFDYFIEKAAYYEFMRDHIAYYSEKSLKNLLEITGFEVVEMSRFNGDTIQAYVKKRKSAQLPDFEGQRCNIQNTINNFIDLHTDEIEKVAVWGASHQALTMLATIDIDKKPSYIIDSSKMKWDKYSPASHLRIISPQEFYNDNVDLVVIIAPAFSQEIAKLIRDNTDTKYILAIKDDLVLEM